MTDEIAAYQAIAAREKACRKEAERLLEIKSRELYDKSVDLERSAAELKATNRVLFRVMNVAPSGILLASKTLSLIGLNRDAMGKFGVAQEAAVGRPLTAFLPGIDAVLAGSGGGPLFVERIDARRRDGTAFTAEVHGFSGPISDEIRHLLIVNDITERLAQEEARKQIDRQMDESRRLEAIGSLSAGLAHEINTPIQFIGDNLDYLADELRALSDAVDCYRRLRITPRTDPRAPRLAARILELERAAPLSARFRETFEALSESRDGIRQVRDIVLLMRDFAHPGSDDMAPQDLGEIATNAVRLCRNRQTAVGVTVDLDLDPDLPPVPCRRGLMQQVVLNLVVNAIDALEETGTPGPRIRVATAARGSRAVLTVSDNGPGVPQGLRDRVFDPFFTTKPVGKGTGQGLALAKEYIVNGHGGRIGLEDVEGFATTFAIELELARAAGHARSTKGPSHAVQ